jgi:hypothetical protein
MYLLRCSARFGRSTDDSAGSKIRPARNLAQEEEAQEEKEVSVLVGQGYQELSFILSVFCKERKTF